MVVTVLGEVPDPGESLVAALVDYLQISDLESRDREVGDFELDVDGVLLVFVAVGRFDCGQLELSIHHVLSGLNGGATCAQGRT